MLITYVSKIELLLDKLLKINSRSLLIEIEILFNCNKRHNILTERVSFSCSKGPTNKYNFSLPATPRVRLRDDPGDHDPQVERHWPTT